MHRPLPSPADLRALEAVADLTPNPELTHAIVDLVNAFYSSAAGRAWLESPHGSPAIYLADRRGVLAGPYGTIEDAAEDVPVIARLRSSSDAITLAMGTPRTKPRFAPSPTRNELVMGAPLGDHYLAVLQGRYAPIYYDSSDALAREQAHRAITAEANDVRVVLGDRKGHAERSWGLPREWTLRVFLSTCSAYGDAFLQGAAWARTARALLPSTEGVDAGALADAWVAGWISTQAGVTGAGAAMLARFPSTPRALDVDPLRQGFAEGVRRVIAEATAFA